MIRLKPDRPAASLARARPPGFRANDDVVAEPYQHIADQLTVERDVDAGVADEDPAAPKRKVIEP